MHGLTLGRALYWDGIGEHARVVVYPCCTVIGVLLTHWQVQQTALTLGDLSSSA
jgi:hypothetical protein